VACQVHGNYIINVFTYLVVSFSALTLLLGCAEDRLACKEILSLSLSILTAIFQVNLG